MVSLFNDYWRDMAEFTPDFKDFYKDLNRWRELYCPFGPTFMERYLERLKMMTDLYYEHGAWDALVEKYGETVADRQYAT